MSPYVTLFSEAFSEALGQVNKEERAVTVDFIVIGPEILQETYTVVLQCIVIRSFDKNRDKIVLQKAGIELIITLADQTNLTSSAPYNFKSQYAQDEGVHKLFEASRSRGFIFKVLRPINDNEYETITEKIYSLNNVYYTSSTNPDSSWPATWVSYYCDLSSHSGTAWYETYVAGRKNLDVY